MKSPSFSVGLCLGMLLSCSDNPSGAEGSEGPPETPMITLERVPAPPGLKLPEGLPGPGLGACDYVNPFSMQRECKQYTGKGWTELSAREDCATVFAGEQGSLRMNGKCNFPTATGVCLVESGADEEYFTLLGGDSSLCKTLLAACEGFAQGSFLALPEGPCDNGESMMPLGPENGVLQPEALRAMESDTLVQVSPRCQDQACVAKLASDKEAFMFTPKAVTAKRGVIIYPGGGVDPRAYGVAAKEIARAGYLVALVPMPSNLAVNGVERAKDVIDENPTITSWVIAGHSLGGVAAAKFVSTNPDAVDGIALWASYPDDRTDLSQIDIKGLTVYGTSDPRSTPEQITESLAVLPRETIAAPIRGGNHSYFTWAGLLDGDDAAELIDQKQQSDLVVGATLHLLARIEAGGADSIHSEFESAAVLEQASGCLELQQLVAGFSELELPRSEITLVHRESFREFSSLDRSSPSVTATNTPRLQVFQYIKQIPNPKDVSAPPVLDGELFCKVNSQDAIVDALGTEVAAPSKNPQGCHLQSLTAYEWALSVVDEDIRSEAATWTVDFQPDIVFETASDFMVDERSFVQVSPGTTSRSINVRSPTFRANLDQTIWGEAAGHTYCKSISYQNALMRIHARARSGAEPWTNSNE
ncbi:MAG: alpha/beta hydrolase [Myxococcota bacterium]|nr:alpha/beta hydrolase [Myxococcota bacterium]